MAAFLPRDLLGLITISIKTFISINLFTTVRSTEGCVNEQHLVAHNSHQQFSSSGYPNQTYNNNEDRCWHIQAQSSSDLVVVEIKDMNIEDSLNCMADNLVFRNGNSENSTLMAKLCGTTIGSYTSSQRHMFIRFMSDDETVRQRGFLVEYYSITSSSGNSGFIEPDDVCDTITYLTATTGYQTILSPDYPNNYRVGIDTCWSIKAEQNNLYVRMEVLVSELQYANPCTLADYVQIRDGPQTSSSLLAEWCGQQKPNSITTTQSSMLIRFRSNNEQDTYRGFKIRYWALQLTNNGNTDNTGLDSTERVMLGVGILITFALIVSAFVYHKKYGKRRPNAVSNLSPGSRRDSRGNPILTRPGAAQRVHMPDRHRGGRGGQGTIVVTPGEPGVYPAYSAPAQPAYGPYGAPPVPPGMIIAPPPYSARDDGGTPLGPPPSRELGQILTLDANMTPPPSYEDIIKDDHPPDYNFQPPNYVNTDTPRTAPGPPPHQSANLSGPNPESNSSQNEQNTRT